MSRPVGSPVELERRRRRAVALMDQGESPTVIARILGTARASLYRWRQQARSRPDGLAAKPHPGPTPRLTDAQLAELEALLLRGAPAHGWANALWTAKRVAALIHRHFGLAFHPEHVPKLLNRRLHWTSQKPQTKAKERDPDAIQHWLDEDFPGIVRAADARDAHLVFLDESGCMLTPVVRRTLAPRGQTPVLPCWDRHDRVSAISAVPLSPHDRHPGLRFRLLPDNTNATAEQVVAFLGALRRSLPRFTVVWDRNRTHGKSLLVRAFLAEHPEVVAEDLPGYAPELNPDEG